MTQTRVILVRHGQSENPADALLRTKAHSTALTELGRAQVEQLSARLLQMWPTWGPVTIYSSTMRRAIETADIIANYVKSSVLRRCDLCSYHLYQDLTRSGSDRPEQSSDFEPTPTLFGFRIERWNHMIVRVSEALCDVAAQHIGQAVLVVGHAETVEASLSAFGNLPLKRDGAPIVANASITEWITDTHSSGHSGYLWNLARLNDTEHLAQQE